MSNETNETQEEMTGNWRGKAYNLQGDKAMNPFHGFRVNAEENNIPEKLVVELSDVELAEVEAAMNLAQNMIANAFRYDPAELQLKPGNPPEPELAMNPFLEALKDYGVGIRPEDVPTTKQVDRMAQELREERRASFPSFTEEESYAPYEEQLMILLGEALRLFLRKNKQYGNAIVRTGALGSLVALTGDVARLRVMLLHTGGLVVRSDLPNIRDKFMDVLVQAAIGIMMIDDENLVGED